MPQRIIFSKENIQSCKALREVTSRIGNYSEAMASEMICPFQRIWLILYQIPLETLFDWTFLLEGIGKEIY